MRHLYSIRIISLWIITISTGLLTCTAGQQQYFRHKPKNTTVLEGGEVVLECEIANLAGLVQWAMDGFVLGNGPVIQGYPRFTVVGDRRHGVYNLKITNATLDDATEYQCQVGPAKGNNVIRANALLDVISPPTSVEIVGHPSNSKIEIQENQDLTLECRAPHSKPPATLVWYRGREELKIDRRKDQVIEERLKNNEKTKRYTVKSSITLKPTSQDDYADLTCEARHEALSRDLPMRTTVQLSVLYPPGPPYIEGYANGEKLRRDQTVELICKSNGGNPPAQLIWYKNSDQIQMAYKAKGRLSENIYTFKADASDNKARYKCAAKNTMISAPLEAFVDLTVHFAPDRVTISGPTEARVNESVTLTCITAASNPAADIRWMINGKQYRNTTSRVSVSPEGGEITTSNITIIVEANRRTISVVCQGINNYLADNAIITHTINVLHPPSEPIITGYIPGSILAFGAVQKVMCISTGGNPLATLTWFKNDKKIINAVTKTTDKQVTSELTIHTNVTDNNAQYRCEASNSATDIPFFESITLAVHFPPEAVRIAVEPKDLKPGMKAKLTCDGASSNPAAVLSWWRDGIPVQGYNNSSKPGLHGGTVSTIELKVNVTQDMNGAKYTCQALNEALQRSVYDSHIMKVLYPPAFDPSTPDKETGIENKPLSVVVKADGNPTNIVFTWTKDGLPIKREYENSGSRISYNGSALNFVRLSKLDAGIYTCEASNSQGSTSINITIEVQYAAIVKAVSKNVLVNPGDEAKISCTVAGNPIDEEHITWSREGYKDMAEKTRMTFDRNTSTSFLHIKNTAREDAGPFRCSVDNGLHNKSRQDVWLLVKFKPEMDSNPSYQKAAANMGDEAELICRCEAAPEPTWSWSRSGVSISSNSTKYYIFNNRLGPMTFESRLRVDKVTSNDYGNYKCESRNTAGYTSQTVNLNITSAPDQVQSLSVVNVTHDSVTLTWVPGFDGGFPTKFRIRYRTIYDDIYKYEDVAIIEYKDKNSTININQWTIRGLQVATDYVFSIMARNVKGESKYRPDDVKATTLILSVQSPSSGNELGPYTFGTYPSMLIITCTIVGTALVLLNVLIIGFCLHRRANKRIRGTIGNKNALLGELNSKITDEILEKQDLSKNLIIGILGASLTILFVLIILVACVLYLRRLKRLREQAGQSSKSATIEMYAPSSYNDTMTGETLSSVSEKSETYSNEDEGGSDHGGDPPSMHHTRIGQAASTYLTDAEGLSLAPPPLEFAPPRYQETHNTLPHPRHHHNTLNRNSMKGYTNSPSPMPPMDGSYYNMTSDRYFAYPPVLQQAHPGMIGRVPTPPQQYGLPIQNQILPPNMMMPGGMGNNTNMMVPGKMGIGASNPNVMMSSPTHGQGGSPPPNYVTNHMDRQVPTPNYIDRPMGGTLGRQRGQNKMAIHSLNGGNPHTVPPDVTVLHGNCNQNHPRSPPPCPAPPQSILKDPSRHLHKQHSNTMSQHSSPINTTQILTVQNLAANDSMHQQSNVPTYGTIKRENKTANKMAAANNDSGIIMNNSSLHSGSNMNVRGEIDTNAV